jgi:hypothetical protein
MRMRKSYSLICSRPLSQAMAAARVWLVTSAALLVTCCWGYFPDLSIYPDDTTYLPLYDQGITEIPTGVFERFFQLTFV